MSRYVNRLQTLNHTIAGRSASHDHPIWVGIDIGSTTVKAVARRGSSPEIIWKDYQRHETRQGAKVREFLDRMRQDIGVGQSNTRLFVTGSGAGSLAPMLGGRFVQEVNAVSMAVEKSHPDVQSVVELGGQDAKILFFQDQPGTSTKKKIATMNDKCAGGTGAVLDKLSAKLHIPPTASAASAIAACPSIASPASAASSPRPTSTACRSSASRPTS